MLSSVFVQVLGVKAISETSVPIINAFASSYNGITYGPLNAIDGIASVSNFWGTSATFGLPQWLTLDLGSVTNVNQVVTHFYDGDARVYTYHIEASTDGSSWFTVVSSTTGSGIVTDSFSDVSARYVRITVTGNTANTAAHIEEIKVFQDGGISTPTPQPTPTPAPTPTPTQAPSQGSDSQISVVNAFASSYNGITYGPLNAIDGIASVSNFWGTSATFGLPQWLTLDLGSVTNVNQVVTHFYDGDARVYTYHIEASTDGSSWFTVVSSTTGSGIVTDSFSDVSARYVRITVTGNTANTAAHIEEIKVFQDGGISTPTPQPTPTPAPTDSPSPTSNPIQTSPPSPTSGNSLPLTGLGGDYLVFSNHDPSEWANCLPFFTQFHSNTARLSFSFADDSGRFSTYSSAKLSAVLTELSSVGVKAIICEYPGDGSQFYGSQAWVNDWKQVAADFRGDSRIKAFELASEPYSYYLAPNANTMSSFNAAISSLIDQIRSIDSSRTIMMPIEFNIFTNDINALYNDFVSHGITSKGNMLYDITHPYYFQDYPRMDGYNNPTDVADGFWYSLVLPQIQKFGASNCYAGEMFCWPRGPNGGWNGQINIDYTSQQIFERRMINYFVNAGMGFQMWCFFASSDQAAQIDALNNSQYYTLIHS